jgi:hypothetical protein
LGWAKGYASALLALRKLVLNPKFNTIETAVDIRHSRACNKGLYRLPVNIWQVLLKKLP